MTRSVMRRMPLFAAVPLVVAVLMAAVGTLASISVLDRLQANQQVELERLIDGTGASLSAAVSAHVAQHDIWSTFDLIDRVMAGQQLLPPSFVMVIDDNGLILASSRPMDFPVGTAPPADILRATDTADISLDDGTNAVGRMIPLRQGGRQVGQLAIAFETDHLVAERREVLLTLIAVNAVLTLLMAGAGYVVVRHMVAPAERFMHRIELATSGGFQPVDQADIATAPPEYATLYRRFNAVVDAAKDRERLAGQLAREEKAALMGKLAASMAHEVNNPLGGLLNAVDTLDRHGDVPEARRESIGLLRRGLNGIRDVVGGMLVAWRRDDGAPWLVADAIDDLKALIGPQVRRKALQLAWDNRVARPVAVSAGAARQIALNLLINATNAAPVGGEVRLFCEARGGSLVLRVQDDGPGIPAAWRDFLQCGEAAREPPDSGALGLWTVRELALREQGSIAVEMTDEGTSVTVCIVEGEMLSHDAA